MRVTKQRLLEMLPGLQVFLDVDDLEDISNLQGYIERSHTILVYCSRGYFESKNVSVRLDPTLPTKRAFRLFCATFVAVHDRVAIQRGKGETDHRAYR